MDRSDYITPNYVKFGKNSEDPKNFYRISSDVIESAKNRLYQIND